MDVYLHRTLTPSLPNHLPMVYIPVYSRFIGWAVAEAWRAMLATRTKQPRVGLNKGKTRKPKGGCNAGRRC